MCCNTDSHRGFQKRGHHNVCFCGCEGPEYFRPRFITKKQEIARLEKHLANLRDEVQAVEEHIAQMKKKK